MTLPGFTAEAATGPASQAYGYAFCGGAGEAGLVLAAFGRRFPTFPPFRCCKYVPYFKSVVCSTAYPRPGATCRCVEGAFGEPIALCQDPILTQG